MADVLERPTWNPFLQCEWKSWRSIGPHTLVADLTGPCDMTGCLLVARVINPYVREVRTFVNGKRDTRYVIGATGEWAAHDE